MKNTYLIYVVLLFCFSIFGAYLKNIPVVITQPDGTKISCFSSGDEFFNRLHDSHDYTILQGSDGWYYYGISDGDKVIPSVHKAGEIDPESAGLKSGVKISEKLYKEKSDILKYSDTSKDKISPKAGIVNNIAVFIRFSDEPDTIFNSDRSYYDTYFNKPDGPSLCHYYREVSYNQLDVNTTFYPNVDSLATNVSYQDINPRSYFEPYNEFTNPGGYIDILDLSEREHSLIERAVLTIADEVPVELGLDNIPDGYIDGIAFLISGSVGEWSSLLWPHMGTLYDKAVFINGKQVRDYNFFLTGSSAYFTVGVIAHEFFHTIGAPDLYHYINWTQPEPVGPWDIMAQTTDPPQHMCAWSKYKYGQWLNSLPVIILPKQYTLNPVTSPAGNIFKIISPHSSNEFFIVEYRKQTGLYESNLPGADDGILIYRVDTSYEGNSNGPPDEIYVYRPDGTLTEHGILEDAQFSAQLGRTDFNESTNPTPFLTTEEFGGIMISEVGYAGENIVFTVGFDSDTNDYTETFDSGDFSKNNWYFEGNQEWIIDDTVSYMGCSAKSGPITHSQSSSMSAYFNFRKEGEISFLRKVISQTSYDFLEFRIDDFLVYRWSGSKDWEEIWCQVDSGTHKLTWKYLKNASISSGSDCAWIDNIMLTGIFRLNSPIGGEVLSKGSQYEIKWTDKVAENVKIELYKNDAYLLTISESSPSGSSCLWTVPNDLGGSDFKIKVTSIEDNQISDMSIGNFSIIQGGILLTSPNSGSVLEMLEDYKITWLDGFSEDVKISLYKGNNSVASFISPSEKECIWNFYTESLTADSDYKLRIESILDSGIFNESDYFSIKGTNGVAGKLYGSLTKLCSPYILTDSTWIDTADILQIEPGVKVKGAKDNNPMNVMGSLVSSGLYNDFIQFRDVDLNFYNCTSSDSSKLFYTGFSRSLPSTKTTGNASVTINDNSKVIIQNCNIQNLNSYGISINNASPVVSDCIISRCEGGIKFTNSASNYIVNNTITGNIDTGVYFEDNSDPMLLNNIIFGNGGFEIYIAHNDSDPEFYYNNIEGGLAGFGLNTGVVFNGAYSQNIISNPFFESDSFKLSAVSPCINRGYPDLTPDVLGYLYIPQKDIYGSYRINGDIDIGCSEYRLILTPDSPANIHISSVDSTVSLTWDVSDYANSYKIYSSDDPYSGYNLVSTVENNSWTSSAGTDTKKFYYVIASSESVKSAAFIKPVENKTKIQKIEDMIRRK